MMLRTGNKGFTLLEVMITTVVLSLGATLIYQSFFISIDSFNYYSTLFKTIPWMDEKIWQTQDNLARLGLGAQLETEGKLNSGGKDIIWNLAYSPIDETGSLFQINLALSWPQGYRTVRLSRSAYANYFKK
jgi:prepilin-type N-terminal cleavage/methylation domain-containing protein